jgi:dipeptidyl aminopeptidase/acylaminoacyl peptidase
MLGATLRTNERGDKTMPRTWRAAVAALGLMAPCAAAAAPLEAYGQLPNIERIAISPSGDLLAIAFVKGEQRTIVVQSLSQNKIVTGMKVTGDNKVRGIEWAGDDDVLIESSTTNSNMSSGDQWFAKGESFVAEDFNIKAHSQQALISDLGDQSVGVNIWTPPTVVDVDGKPQVFLIGYRRIVNRIHATLLRYDLATRRSLVASDGFDATGAYVVGPDGRALAEAEYNPETKDWVLKISRGGAWRQVISKSAPIDTPELLGLGRDGQSVLLGQVENDRYVRREVSLDGAVSDPLPFPESSTPIRDPLTHRIIGVEALEGDGYAYRFFDPADQAQWDVITKAFPGQIVRLVSSSDDRKRLVLRVDSPTEGPGYVLIDLRRGGTTWLGAEYSSLGKGDIGPVRPVRFKAADGLDLTGYLTLPYGREAKGLPLVVFPHGGPAARDPPGFDWWAQAMASHGYAVLQVNYRGSDGFGFQFESAGFGQFGRKMQSDLSDGVRHLAQQGVVDPKRVCIVGASYGGYAALAGATLEPAVYRCAVSVAGPAKLERLVSLGALRGGPETERYWKRYLGIESLSDPRLAAISPADQADKAVVPILLIHGKDDTVVPFEQSQTMCDALHRAGKTCDLVVLDKEDHWLSRSDTRLQMLKATIDFLEKNNPPGPTAP